jgi:glycosyltransferase involved in cell wall biosynthesis
MRRLLVIVPDRISDILAKGEYQPLYYNPAEFFQEVHILTTNDDRPDLEQLRRTVGGAKLAVHNLPEAPEIIGQRWRWQQRRALKQWAAPAVDLARRVQPDLIRCHGSDWNICAARRIKATLGIPYVVSLHINPDINSPRRYLGPNLDPAQQRHNRFFEMIEADGLRNADLVMPVYRPIISYLERLGVQRYEVCYNVLNRDHLPAKMDYTLHQPPRIIYVGRLFDDKDPGNIIRAVAALAGVTFTIVGDGPRRPALEALARECGVADRVTFRPAVANDELCRMLPEFDIFAVHTEYWELSKSVLEAFLIGLPVVINRRKGPAVPELEEGDFVLKVDNTVEDYRNALDQLLTDGAARAALGRRAFAHARAQWAPEKTEAKYVEIYRRFMLRHADAA